MMEESKISYTCRDCRRITICNHIMTNDPEIEQCCTEFNKPISESIEKLIFEPRKTIIVIGNMKYPEFVKFSSKVANEHYEYEVIHQLLLHYQMSNDKSMFEIIDSMQLGKFKDFIKELLEREVIRL